MRSSSLHVNLLGPLEVIRDGKVRTPSAPMQRALLALLTLHAGEVLPASRIIDVLWRGRPPSSAGPVLQMYVAGIRRSLAPPGVPHQGSPLRTEPSGYTLELRPEQHDLAQFRSLALQGRSQRGAGRCARAAALFRRALGLWRGTALADLDRIGTFAPYVVRLEEERLALEQERISVYLCQGRSNEVIGELGELCLRWPLCESLHQQLMLALHQTGRRADALAVYTRVRSQLVEEVGLEPGPGLRATQRAILAGRDLPGFTHPPRRAPRGVFRACDPAVFGGWN